MTFDEAIEKVEQLANFEVGKTTGDIRRDLKLELGDVRDLLTELREEYAPTIEMTKRQLDEIARFKSMFPTRAFADIIYNGQDGEWTYLDELSGHLWGHRQHGATNKNIEDTMKAYLYPETIKVVDE